MPSRLIESLATTEEMAEVFSDAAVLGAMLRFEAALAAAQARLGMIPGSAAEAIARVATVEKFDAAAIAREARESASVAIPLVKALTAAVGGESSGFVHWGATSQDVLDTALVLMLARARAAMEAEQARIEAGLRDLSQRHAGTVMLARTLLQPAAPTTFGYKAAGWFAQVRRCWRRLARAFEEALVAQFGGAAGTLASYGERGVELGREVARELGLGEATPWHAHRDRLAAVVANCGIYTGAMGKIARDVSLLMQAEVGEVAERGGGSSAMPGKRNPAGSAMVLAAAVRVPGMISSFLMGMVQEHERACGGWQAEWPTVTEVVQATGSAMATLAEMTGGLTVNAERMRANLEAAGGAVFAEKAAMELAEKVGRETAQSRVAEMLKDGSVQGRAEDWLGSAESLRQRLLETE